MKTKAVILPLVLIAPLFGADDDWPRWRGPWNNGVARGDAPLEWSDTKNVGWKVDIPGRGFSTPVLWGNKIFLTTAVPVGEPVTSAPPPQPPPGGPGGPPPGGPGGPGGPPRGGRGPGGGAGAGQEHKFIVLALDRKTGKVLWEQTVKTAVPHEGYHGRYGSFASNSPVTDGKYLYASFGSRGVYCLDLNGKLIWKKEDVPQMRMRNAFGEGVAPTIDEKNIYLKYDQQQGSTLITLDRMTGKELWRVDRDEQSSWSAPVLVTHGGKKQLIVAGAKVRAYEPDSGKVIWEAGMLGSNQIPQPVVQNDVVIAMSGYQNPNLLAIKLGGEGDLSGTNSILWTNQRGNSYTASPVLHDNKIYILTDNGQLSCFNATTGEAYYRQQRLPKPYNFKASPVAANGKLYLATEEGDVVVVKMGEQFEILATNTMEGQFFVSSPVISDGEIFLRSDKSLFCIRAGK